MMDMMQGVTNEQARTWNGPSGRAWVEMQAVLDQLFEPFQAVLMDAVPAGASANLLDVGCGAGATTLAAARKLGRTGRATGIDISQPLVTEARAHTRQADVRADFLLGDAQRYRFEAAQFDIIISRFGVMFFDDPVAAFRNLRHAAKPGAELWFIAWRGPDENPFMTAAERTAATLLPDMPPRRPDAPGQFAFANRDKMHRIIEESGWIDVEIGQLDIECRLPKSELDRYISWLGPLGTYLQSVDEPTRARVLERVRPAFDPYRKGNEIRFNAACWIVGARNPG